MSGKILQLVSIILPYNLYYPSWSKLSCSIIYIGYSIHCPGFTRFMLPKLICAHKICWFEENPFGEFDDMVMFCYFSSLPKLHSYLNAFLGSHVLIIGPIQTPSQYFVSNNNDEEYAGVELTEIFKLPKADWKLILLKQFGLIKTDHIAIYRRIEKTFAPPNNRRYII